MRSSTTTTISLLDIEQIVDFVGDSLLVLNSRKLFLNDTCCMEQQHVHEPLVCPSSRTPIFELLALRLLAPAKEHPHPSPLGPGYRSQPPAKLWFDFGFLGGKQGVNFINVFTRSFYTRRSRKRKKLLGLTIFFCDFGIFGQQSCSLNVGEIDTRLRRSCIHFQTVKIPWEVWTIEMCGATSTIAFSTFKLFSISDW